MGLRDAKENAPASKPCDILPDDKRFTASEQPVPFPRNEPYLLSDRHVATSSGQPSRGAISFFASPTRLFRLLPVSYTIPSMAMDIHGIGRLCLRVIGKRSPIEASRAPRLPEVPVQM